MRQGPISPPLDHPAPGICAHVESSGARNSVPIPADEGGSCGVVAVDIGVREWLDAASTAPVGSRAAAFGTKAATPPWLPGSAARGVGRRLRRSDYELAADPMDFLVTDIAGPLADGELERARTWAQRLATAELHRAAHRT